MRPVTPKRRRLIEEHWLSKHHSTSRNCRPYRGSLLGLYENVGGLSVELPHEGMMNNMDGYRVNVNHKQRLNEHEEKFGAKVFREGLELLGMLYMNGEHTRLYHHYPGKALE